MNSMGMYNNIQYEQLQPQRSFDNYTRNLSKSINNNTKSNNNVNHLIRFDTKI